MKVSLAQKTGEIVPDDSFVLDPAKLRQAVREVGFNSGEIEAVLSGRIVAEGDVFHLVLADAMKLPLERDPLTERLAREPQPVRVLVRTIEETKAGFKLKIIERWEKQ